MLKTMDPALIRQLIAGVTDALTPEAEAEAALYRSTQCPVCGERECQKKVKEAKIVPNEDGEPIVAVSPFGQGLLPEGYAHCIHCGTDFNPLTGMIYKTEASMIHGPD